MQIAAGAKSVGQINGFFRWRVLADSDAGFEIELRLASAEELETEHFVPPERTTATVGVRRIQSAAIAGAKRLEWSYDGRCGAVERDGSGSFAIPRLEIARTPQILRLTPSTLR